MQGLQVNIFGCRRIYQQQESEGFMNDNINPVNDNIIQSNDICDYCATVYGSITCRACQPVNGHSGFQGKTVRPL